MADIFDELVGEGAPAPELIAALRRQRNLGRVGALSGDRHVARLGGAEYDDAMKQAAGIRDTRERGQARADQQAFQKWQQQQAIASRNEDRAFKREALAQARALGEERNRIAGLSAARRQATAGLTPFDKEYQRKVAGEAVDWDTRGRPVAEQSLAVLTDARKTLADPKAEDKGGEWLPGLIPDNVRALYNSDRLALQQAINSITVQNLREAFGAQFTQKENEQFRALEYDPSLSNAQNLEKLDRKIALIEGLAKAKEDAVRMYRSQSDIGGGSALDAEVLRILGEE